MRRNDREDPVLSEFVRERLAQLLAENVPRRARPPEPDARGPSLADRAGAVPSGARAGFGARVGSGPSADTWVSSAGSAGDDGELAPRSFRRAHLGVVCVLLTIGLLCAGWTVLRARPVAIASPQLGAPSAAPSVTSGGATPGAEPRAPASVTPPAPVTTTPAAIVVHVLGAVKRPGVVSLGEHARVRDAIEAAGGLTSTAAPGELNLAQVLSDGQQIIIGTRKRPTGEVRDGSSGGDPGGGSTAAGSGATVDLNSATQAQLEELPGVGPVTAGKIIAWRTEHGRFSRLEELQEVDGIGPKTFAQIAPHARV